MATSQNGWAVRTSSLLLKPLPWITGRVLPGDVYTIFDYLCTRFDAEVEPINPAHSWGYAYRSVRGQTSGFSNHASATAIDLNAPAHPLGERGTFTTAQVVAINAILSRLDGVVRWGGHYSGRPDEMHFEINADAQRVALVARGLSVSPTLGVTRFLTAPNLAERRRVAKRLRKTGGTAKIRRQMRRWVRRDANRTRWDQLTKKTFRAIKKIEVK